VIVCKTVRLMLCDRCLSCPVCDVGVLWPNGCTDQDATWYRGRPRPRRHCVRWRPSSPSPKGAQQQPPTFRSMSIVAKRSPISATAELLLMDWLCSQSAAAIERLTYTTATDVEWSRVPYTREAW